MRILAYCGLSMKESAYQVTGVVPLTCPPLNSDTFDVDLFLLARHIYLDLHGESEGEELFEIYQPEGEVLPTRITALTEQQILALGNLSGTTVFATTCYIPETPVMRAFLKVGADVIGGSGDNYSADTGTVGASRLAKYYFKYVDFLTPASALYMAKRFYQGLALGAKTIGRPFESQQVIDDTLQFTLYRASDF